MFEECYIMADIGKGAISIFIILVIIVLGRKILTALSEVQV